jgi:mRNA interferase RelE/StbE
VNYSVVISREPSRELTRLPKSMVKRVFAKLDGLGINPRPSGSKKLVGYVDLWRIRVGDYRVIYRIEDDRRVVTVLRIQHRRDAYDQLP